MIVGVRWTPPMKLSTKSSLRAPISPAATAW